MSLPKAIKFIKKYSQYPEFRMDCYQFSRKELYEKYGFNELELDEALNMRLVQCQTYDEALKVKQLRFSINLFI